MVSAPDTNCTSRHLSPASARAARAAASPYSTKLRPHLPHGCMPTPRTATLRSSGTGSSRCRRAGGAGGCGAGGPGGEGPPLPDEVLVLVVLVQRVEDELDLGAHAQVVHPHTPHHLAQHHHLLVGELNCCQGEGLERVG